MYKLDVHTVEDLLYLLPRRYTDYSDPYQIAYAPYDEPAAVLATVLEIGNGIRAVSYTHLLMGIGDFDIHPDCYSDLN